MKRVVVISGAGISAESGCATFRGADGLWRGKVRCRLDTGRIEVRLDDPAVIEPGDRFSIRWRGKAIGIGVVTGGFGDR